MPARDVEKAGPFVAMEALSRAARVAVDHEFQRYWYEHMAAYVLGKTVLDAGAGMGYGKRIMEANGAMYVECFDLVALVPWVKISTMESYAAGSFDWVVAMDVIEHVDDDEVFLQSMLRTAREGIFFSTPNWDVFHCKNEHHRREYTPAELHALVERRRLPAVTQPEVRYFGADVHCAITERTGTALEGDDDCQSCFSAVLNFGVLMKKN